MRHETELRDVATGDEKLITVAAAYNEINKQVTYITCVCSMRVQVRWPCTRALCVQNTALHGHET